MNSREGRAAGTILLENRGIGQEKKKLDISSPFDIHHGSLVDPAPSAVPLEWRSGALVVAPHDPSTETSKLPERTFAGL
jgi:hypothetical protein